MMACASGTVTTMAEPLQSVERNASASSGDTMSEARLKSLLEMAVDGIVIIAADGRILMYNRACERLFGYPLSAVLGRNVAMLMPSAMSRRHDDFVGSYLDTGERRIIGIGREVEAQHADGTIFPVELSVAEADTVDGRQFVGILRDLRPRRAAEERLSELQASLFSLSRITGVDAMGGALAHELNQPLTALLLYLRTLQRLHNRGGEGVADLVEKAIKEAERAGQIIQRMRQFVQRREPQRELCEINALVEDAVELTLMGRRHRPRIIRDFGADLPRVSVDPVQVQQVIVNLLRNALDAVAAVDHPRVTISTALEDDAVLLAVADNGPGIPPDRVSKLFRPFETQKSDGLGLGLAISRTIAQNHGGDLRYEPASGEGGAHFTLAIPVRVRRSGSATAGRDGGVEA
jgi:two-component system sensor kinase FixL